MISAQLFKHNSTWTLQAVTVPVISMNPTKAITKAIEMAKTLGKFELTGPAKIAIGKAIEETLSNKWHFLSNGWSLSLRYVEVDIDNAGR
jgi:hypothetical protein